MAVHRHVHPRNDLIEHEMTDDCVCGPRVEPIKSADGSMGWLVVHASLDGRENHEPPPAHMLQ